MSPLACPQTEPALERIAYELAEDAAADGVRYIEVRYAPVLNTREGQRLVIGKSEMTCIEKLRTGA